MATIVTPPHIMVTFYVHWISSYCLVLFQISEFELIFCRFVTYLYIIILFGILMTINERIPSFPYFYLYTKLLIHVCVLLRGGFITAHNSTPPTQVKSWCIPLNFHLSKLPDTFLGVYSVPKMRSNTKQNKASPCFIPRMYNPRSTRLCYAARGRISKLRVGLYRKNYRIIQAFLYATYDFAGVAW
jgi:hypothetical protein